MIVNYHYCKKIMERYIYEVEVKRRPFTLDFNTHIFNEKIDRFYVQGHFPVHPVMPCVLFFEAFVQAAAALTAH